MTQKEAILKYIDQFGCISQAEAFTDLGIGRLSARVYDLIHQDGIDSRKKIVTAKNRYGQTIQYASYYREKEDV